MYFLLYLAFLSVDGFGIYRSHISTPQIKRDLSTIYPDHIRGIKFLEERQDKLQSDDFRMIGYYSGVLCREDVFSDYENNQLTKAVYVAYLSHLYQRRNSGEPFITHPFSVALILASSKADCVTIIGGLLHDTVEDTELTFQDIYKLFGLEVTKIVEGETKVSKLPKMRRKNKAYKAYKEDGKREQDENLRKMFIAMSDDWRIIVLKLADRLHNMRTLQYMSHPKRVEIAKETLSLFAPLAHRLGLWMYKVELEDLSFRYAYSEEYIEVSRQLENRKELFEDNLYFAEKQIINCLQSMNIQSYDIQMRTKTIYSIWRKMMDNSCNIEGILDLMAIRIILKENTTPFDDISMCYLVLGQVHRLWTPLPKTLKDYLSHPKPNGYKSLHTTVLINGYPVEIQIRTTDMHYVAEWGTAAHWAYKSDVPNRVSEEMLWLRKIQDWDVDSPSIFMERVRNELLGTRTFVFGPNGDIMNLGSGTTLGDLVTSGVLTRDHIMVNGVCESLCYKVKNGDLISY